MNSNSLVLNPDEYDFDAIEKDYLSLAYNDQYFESLRPYFSQSEVNLGIENADKDLDDQNKKQIILSSLYAGKFKTSPLQALDDFNAQGAAFHGEDNLSIDEQWNRISKIYNLTAPSQKTSQVNTVSGIFNMPVNRNETPEEVKERNDKLNYIFSNKPLNEMLSFGLGEKIKDLAMSWGRGSVGILSGISGAMRVLPEIPYTPSVPTNTNPAPQMTNPDEIANFLDDYIKIGMDYYKQNRAIQSEWKLEGKGKYTDPYWWINNITGLMPFIVSTGGIGGVTGTATLKALGGAGKLARWGAVANSTVAMSVTEALTEAGNAAQQVKERGGTDEQAGIAAWSSFGKNSVMLSGSNFLQMALARMPGKIGKALALAVDAPIESTQELVQDRWAKEAIVKALPQLVSEINPDKNWIETFDVINNEEKRDTALLAGILGVKDWGTSLYLATKEKVMDGKSTPAQLMQSEQAAIKNLVEVKNKLNTQSALTVNEIKQKELLDKYINSEGMIKDLDSLAQEYYDLKREQNKKTAEEISKGELNPEEMTRADFVSELNLPENTTLTNDELRLTYEKKEIEKAGIKKSAFEDLVNYMRTATQDKIVINTIDELMTAAKKIGLGYNVSEMKKAIKAQNLSTEEAVIKGENIASYDEMGKDLINLYQGADYKTIVHEVSHSYSNRIGKYNEKTGEFDNIEFNSSLDVAAKLYTDHGEYVSPDKREFFSKLSEDYIEGIKSESFFSKLPEKLKQILETIKQYITSLTNGAKVMKELVESKAMPEEMITHIENAIQGKITNEEINNIKEQNPEVKEAINQLNEAEKVLPEKTEKTFTVKSKFKKFLASSPVVSFINENGKIGAKPKDYQGGEYDGMPEREIVYPYNTLYMAKEGQTPDQMSQMLFDRGLINKPTPDAMWQSIEGEISRFRREKEDIAQQEQALTEKGKQADNFKKDVLTDKTKTFDNKVVKADSLNVGDKIVVKYKQSGKEKTEELKVTSIDPETMDIELSDGERYGVQTIADDETIYVLKVKSAETNFQLGSISEIADEYVKAYDKVRRAENVFAKFGINYYLDKAGELKNQILGRLEEITGKVAPIGQGKALEETYMKTVRGKVRYMKSDEYATEKFVENLRNGSEMDLKYMQEELERMEKQITAQSFEAGRLTKAANITREDIKKIQTNIENLIKILPREVQAFAMSRIKTAAGKEGKAAQRYIQDTLEAIKAIKERNEAYEQRIEIKEWLKLGEGKVNQSGRLYGRTVTADVIKDLKEIKKVIDLDSETVSIKESMLENMDELTSEQEAEHYYLQTFGALKEKTPDEVRIAYEQLKELIEKGKLERKVKDNYLREKYQKQSEEAVKSITAKQGGELLEGEESHTRAAKQNRYWWRVAQMPFNYMFKHMRFDYMNNALERYNKEVEPGKGYLHKLFSSRVIKATQSEKTEIRQREIEYRDSIKKILGFTKNKQLLDWFKQQNRKEETNIVKNVMETKVQKFAFDEANTFINKYLEDLKLPEGQYIKPSDLENFARSVDMAIEMKNKGKDYQQEFKLNISVSKNKPFKLNISKAQARVLWMVAKQDDVLENLYYNGYTEESFAELEKFLDDNDKKVSNWMLDQYDKNYERMNKVYEELFNIPMPKIKNYSPFVTVYNKGSNSGNQSVQATLTSMTSGGQISSTANPKSTIKRVPHYRDLDIENINADNIYLKSFRESAHFIHWGVLARDLRGVYKKENVRNAISQVFNRDKVHAVNHIVDSLIRGGVLTEKQIEIVNRMRNLITKLILSGKMPNLFKQMTGHAAIMGEVSVKDYVKYTTKFFKDPVKNILEVKEHEYLKNRWYNGFSQDLNLVIERSHGKPPGYFNKALENGMLPTRFGDYLPSAIGYWSIWKQQYDQNIKAGMSKEEADAQARLESGDIIDRTQQASNTKDLGYYQLQGSWMNLCQMFLTANRLYMTNVYDAIADAAAGKKGAAGKLGKKIFVYNVLCPILYQAAGDICKMAIAAAAGDDYEPEWEDYAVASITGPASGLWVIGNLFTWGTRKAFGQYSTTPQIVPGTGALIESAWKTGEDIAKGEDIQKVLYDAIGNTGLSWIKPIIKEK